MSDPPIYRPISRDGRRRRAGLGAGRRLTAQRPRHRLLRVVLVIVVLVSIMSAAAVAIAYAEYQNLRGQLPDAATLAGMEQPLDSHVYSRDGTLLAVLHNQDFRHEHIALADMSRWVKLATVDVEDRHFYEHSSWDLPRIVKAGWDNLRGNGTTQGASTITEQLAKISFLSPERSIDRKIKQVILGVEIEQSFSKDQILEMYLNRIEYGNHAIGIQSAAETFFHKSAHDLDLAEASLLSGLPNSPTAYNPLNHDAGVPVNPLAKQRQHIVLQAMVSTGDITQQQADAAYAEPLAYHPWYDSEPSIAPDFVALVRQWLNSSYGDAYIKPGGWNITTTLDLGRQAMAEKTLHDGVASVAGKNAHDGALVSIQPGNGEVLALVGAWDDNDPGVGQLNMALRPVRPGSTIKLFTYTAAIASRQFTMRTPILDAPVKLDDGSSSGYSPKNYDRRWHGTCLLQVCLGNSLNVPAVKVEAKVGIPLITNLEIASGLTSLSNPDNRPGPKQYAATLGGLRYGITPLELADGVATIAGLGVHYAPMPVLKIVDGTSGRVLFAYDPATAGRRVIPANVAFVMSEITSNDQNRVAEFGAHGDLTLPDRRVSAKTGTTEFFSDNWTVGWTPELATAVWVGNPTPSCLRPQDAPALQAALNRGNYLYSGQTIDDPYSPGDLAHYRLAPINGYCGHLEGSTGITGAAPIWNHYMRQALTVKTWYRPPSDVVTTGGGDDGYWYLPGTLPTTAGLGGTACYYWGVRDPNNPCTYTGPTPPPPGTNPLQPTPSPGPRPSPIPTGAPGPTPGPTRNPHPSPPPTP